MKKFLKFSLTVVAIATATLGSGAPVLARGGAASIMNSPGISGDSRNRGNKCHSRTCNQSPPIADTSRGITLSID